MNIALIILFILIGIIFVLSSTGSFAMIVSILILPNYSDFLKEKDKYKTFITTMVIFGIIAIASMIILILMDKSGVMFI